MRGLKDRLRASGIHLGISAGVALLAAALVFLLWYPAPFDTIVGGRGLFVLVVTVDVILGPLITFAVFNRAKPWTELRRDLAIVGMIQCAGLAYGLWTVAQVRPVHVVFEIDRLRVVSAVDVPDELLARVPAGQARLPWTGPTLMAARPLQPGQEHMEYTMAALQGVQIGFRPELWQPYESARTQVLAEARPVADLRRRKAAQAAKLDAGVAATGRSAAELVYLPLVSRQQFWTALIDARDARVLAYVDLDPY